MATIYKAPSSIKVPSLSKFLVEGKFDRKGYNDAEEAYKSELKAFLLKRKQGEHIGEVLSFQYADGYAQYMVMSMKPLELVHIPLGDAWDYPEIDKYKAKDILEHIKREKAVLGYDKVFTNTEDLAKKSTKSINIMEELYEHIRKEMEQKGNTVWGLHSGVTSFTTHAKKHVNRENGAVESLMVGGAYQYNQKSLRYAQQLCGIEPSNERE